MIQSTKGKRATSAIKGKYGKGFTGDLVKRTRAMLTALDAAVVMEDLGPIGRFVRRITLSANNK